MTFDGRAHQQATATTPAGAADKGLNVPWSALLIAGGLIWCAASHAAAPPAEPFEGVVFAGAAYDDNLFRLEGEEEALESLGTDELDDWYRYVGAGFRANFPGDERRVDIDAEIFRQTFDTFDDLDHTGGRFAATGEWQLAPDTRGILGYAYQRRLQSFTNKESTARDIQRIHTVNGAIERNLAERWQLRVDAGWSDLEFSNSDFLDKQRLDGEVELRYAASQNSIFGLLATYTDHDFDEGGTRDFSGWSLGPSFEWQITSRFQLSANVGYTHRGLDDPGDLDDYDGVTGFVAALWSPRETFSHELRVFRDVSNLGGEVSEYTERTGLRWRPRWQLTPKLATRFSLAFEERDFSAVDDADDRRDDYLLADLWFDFDLTRRLLVSLGYAYEDRQSNEAGRDFDAHVFRGELRFTF